MQYRAVLPKHGLVLLLTLIAGFSLATESALAKPKGLRTPPPPDRITATLASLPVSGPNCGDPSLSQPFTSYNDFAYYTPAPGGNAFSGWILLGGATPGSTTLASGGAGSALNLSSGSLAISPPMCVDANYPRARTMVRNLVGGGGVNVFVIYAGNSGWGKARNAGNAHGKGSAWGLSDQLKVQPSHAPGWQLVRFAFAPSGDSSQFQIYNFYVDPYAKG